jgi:WD40 repeat protein
MGAIRLVGWGIVIALAFVVPGRCQEPPREPQKGKVRVDFYGDPLPEGAIARLGTVRFRCAGAVHAVAFSGDGKLLAASSDGENMVVLRDRVTGRKLREIPVGGRGNPPTHLRFSSDGKRLYSSMGLWDVETGAVARDLPRLPAGARLVGYSPDGREVILLQQKEIVRWDVEKGREVGRYPNPETGYLNTAALVGERLLVPQFDGQAVILWDAAQKKQLWSVKTTREKNYPGLPRAFSADGKLFAVEAPPRVISVYESVTGKLVRRLETDVEKIYWSCSISPDARTVTASCWDGSLRLFDLESGRQRVKIPAIEGWCTTAFFAPDSKAFATGGPNNPHAVLLWETATGKRIDPFPRHTSPLSSVSFSPDGRMAATCSSLRGDPVVRLWDPQTGRLLRSLDASNAGGVSDVAFSPDGRTLASCDWSGEKKVRIWDVRTGRERHALAGHEGGCTRVAFSPDGKRLASGDAYYNRKGQQEGRLCIWDAEAGKLLREVRGTRGAIQQVAFTGDGRHVLAAANGIHVYDADTGQLVGEPFLAPTRIWSTAPSINGRLLATTDGFHPVRLWELASRREIPLAVPGGNGYGVTLSPDGHTLAVTTGSLQCKNVVLFHWPSGQTVGRVSIDGGVRFRAFFTPDGRRLAVLPDVESSALIWDVAGMVKRPLAAAARPAAADLRQWWASLRDDNPAEAYKAVWRFAAVPEHAVPFLAEVLRPSEAQGPGAATIARWINDLDSSEFRVREKASRELERAGVSAVDALRKARKGDVSLEQKRRIDQLLAALDGPIPGPEQLRAIRAVAALEQIGNPEARKVLGELAAGGAGARLTREARAALERLKRADPK